jgi:hypothetical protein
LAISYSHDPEGGTQAEKNEDRSKGSSRIKKQQDPALLRLILAERAFAPLLWSWCSYTRGLRFLTVSAGSLLFAEMRRKACNFRHFLCFS